MLSATVATNNCYGRVHLLNWGCSDAEGIAASLLEPSLCPTELHLRTDHLSEESFSSLCQALSSSLQIESLTVVFSEEVTSVYEDCLRKAFEENVSLKSVALDECYDSMGSALLAAQGLCSNKFVTELAVDCYRLDPLSVSNLSWLVAKNEALNSVELVCCCALTKKSMDLLTRGVVQNRFITDFSINADVPICSMTAILAAQQRNRVCLYGAVRFVLGRNQGKRCAEAFELLCSKTSLVAKVVKTSNITEAEAKAAVEAAKLFVWHNYLLINEVVCHKLECHVGNGTQIDQLNFDCWLAITKYLKVSDIICK